MRVVISQPSRACQLEKMASPERKAAQAAWYKAKRAEDPDFLDRERQRDRSRPPRPSAQPRRAGYHRKLHLSKYGLTPETYDLLRADQNFSCSICYLHETEAPWGRLVVDHDHETNKVRALLCNHCNVTIGHAKERPDILRAAARYLETHT